MRACYASKNLPSTRNETRKSNNFPLCTKVSREKGFIYDFRLLSERLQVQNCRPDKRSTIR
ncbi:hypothetical protein DUQ00_17090 [Salmonella bongori]|nr:hypothetical protein [Salmonella bongori]ECC9597983.1 hypothetical protein [Salmonella bongori]